MKMRSGRTRLQSKELVEEEPVEEPPQAASTGKKQKSKRELRKEQREVLRSKSLGLIRLSDDKTQKPKKIVFGDDDDSDVEKEEDDKLEEIVPTTKDDDNKEEEDDSDDDMVEQVSGKAAREAELQRELETRAAAQQAAKKKKKRKSRRQVEEEESSDDDDEEIMEEDFFAELDAQKSALRKARKQSKGGDAAISKHTIFHSSNDDDVPRTPIEVMPGMELVVLEDEDEENADLTTALSLVVTEAPSPTALQNSRVVVDGSDVISAKQKQKQKKLGLAPPPPTWRRSQKTNRILLNKGRGGRKGGKAAANFVVKAKVKTYKF